MIQKYTATPQTHTKYCGELFYFSSGCFYENELSEGWSVVVVVVFQSRKHVFNLAIVSTINAEMYDPRCRQIQIKK